MNVKENILRSFEGKKLLCIENDNGLHHGLDKFEDLLKELGIEYRVIFDASGTPMEEILAAIDWCDGVFFQTRWVYEISKKLLDYLSNYPRHLDIIEVPLGEPSWYYKSQAGADQHDYYLFFPGLWGHRFYKLSEKAYWDYENKFDS